MERESRKRSARDEEEREQIESKKQECASPPSNSSEYEFCEGIGIFDFPWLKDGVIFGDHDEKFPPLDDYAFAPNFESFVEEKVCVSPGPDRESFFGGGDDDDDSFWSLLVDVDREQIDCIWSCVLDQPLDIGFNKL